MALISAKVAGDLITSSDANTAANKWQNATDSDVRMAAVITSNATGLSFSRNVAAANAILVSFTESAGDSTAIVQSIANAGTGSGLYLNQSGVLGVWSYGLYVYSNAAQATSQLVKIHNDNASSTATTFDMYSDGAGSAMSITTGATTDGISLVHTTASFGNYSSLLRLYSNVAETGTNAPLLSLHSDNAASTALVQLVTNDGVGTALKVTQVGVLGNNEYGLYVYSNAVQVNSSLLCYMRQSNASSSSNVLEVDNFGTGSNTAIIQAGVLAGSKFGLHVYSNAAQTNSYLMFVQQDNASSTIAAIAEINDGTGAGLSISCTNTGSADNCIGTSYASTGGYNLQLANTHGSNAYPVIRISVANANESFLRVVGFTTFTGKTAQDEYLKVEIGDVPTVRYIRLYS